MNLYVILALVIINSFCTDLSAKCINTTHAKIRIIGKDAEETKQYKCRVLQHVEEAFDANQQCTYCGCLKSYHDNERETEQPSR